MAVKIRLSRVGKKAAPFYRIVAVDERRKRDGASLEVLGTYNPLKGELVQFDQERISYWLSQGAIATDAVKRLQKKQSATKAA
jgi:small subunit ribosomal protein S16